MAKSMFKWTGTLLVIATSPVWAPVVGIGFLVFSLAMSLAADVAELHGSIWGEGRG